MCVCVCVCVCKGGKKKSGESERGFMNDREEVVVWCFQVICLTNFSFFLSPSLFFDTYSDADFARVFSVMACFAAEEI